VSKIKVHGSIIRGFIKYDMLVLLVVSYPIFDRNVAILCRALCFMEYETRKHEILYWNSSHFFFWTELVRELLFMDEHYLICMQRI